MELRCSTKKIYIIAQLSKLNKNNIQSFSHMSSWKEDVKEFLEKDEDVANEEWKEENYTTHSSMMKPSPMHYHLTIQLSSRIFARGKDKQEIDSLYL